MKKQKLESLERKGTDLDAIMKYMDEAGHGPFCKCEESQGVQKLIDKTSADDNQKLFEYAMDRLTASLLGGFMTQSEVVAGVLFINAYVPDIQHYSQWTRFLAEQHNQQKALELKTLVKPEGDAVFGKPAEC